MRLKTTPELMTFRTVPAQPRFPPVFFSNGGIRQAFDLLVVRRFGQVAHANHHCDRDHKDQKAVILKIDVVHNPEERALGIAVLKARHAQADRCINCKTKDTEHESRDERGEGIPERSAALEDAKKKHDEDRRGQIPLNPLQIVVKSLASADHRNHRRPISTITRSRSVQPRRVEPGSPAA